MGIGMGAVVARVPGGVEQVPTVSPWNFGCASECSGTTRRVPSMDRGSVHEVANLDFRLVRCV